MKRLHLHLAVADLAASTRFYGALFGRAPTRSEPGYAKWQLDEPAVNFAISTARAAMRASITSGSRSTRATNSRR